MEIKIEEYLAHEDIKEIVADEVKGRVRAILSKEKDLERMVSNAAYGVVWKMVDEQLDDDLCMLMKNKVQKIIDEMTFYNVVKAPNAWDNEPNSAYKIIQKRIEDNFDKIRKVVDDSIEPSVKESLASNLDSYIHEAIIEAIRK